MPASSSSRGPGQRAIFPLRRRDEPTLGSRNAYGGPVSVSSPTVPIGWKRVHAFASSQQVNAWPARRAVADRPRATPRVERREPTACSRPRRRETGMRRGRGVEMRESTARSRRGRGVERREPTARSRRGRGVERRRESTACSRRGRGALVRGSRALDDVLVVALHDDDAAGREPGAPRRGRRRHGRRGRGLERGLARGERRP